MLCKQVVKIQDALYRIFCHYFNLDLRILINAITTKNVTISEQ